MGKIFEFVLNFRSAQRGAALPLLCPGAVCAIYKRQFGTAVLKPGQLPCEPYMPLPLASYGDTCLIGRSRRDRQDVRSRRGIIPLLDAVERRGSPASREATCHRRSHSHHVAIAW